MEPFLQPLLIRLFPEARACEISNPRASGRTAPSVSAALYTPDDRSSPPEAMSANRLWRLERSVNASLEWRSAYLRYEPSSQNDPDIISSLTENSPQIIPKTLQWFFNVSF